MWHEIFQALFFCSISQNKYPQALLPANKYSTIELIPNKTDCLSVIDFKLKKQKQKEQQQQQQRQKFNPTRNTYLSKSQTTSFPKPKRSTVKNKTSEIISCYTAVEYGRKANQLDSCPDIKIEV